MLRTPQFYVLYAMFVMMSIGGLMVTANAGPMAQAWGLTTAALTLAATLSPLANGASRIFWGWASDKLGRETTMVIAFGLQAVSLFMVLALGHLSAAWFAFTLVLTYFTWGEIFSLFPSTLGDYFGTRHATSNYSVLYTAKGVASIVGGGLAALLFERFGSWSAAFYGSATLALVATALAYGLRASRSPKAIELASAVPAK
jgi:OFA family oxalate/formate antiporter-like MFS transporter